jgi:hypothetical protein
MPLNGLSLQRECEFGRETGLAQGCEGGRRTNLQRNNSSPVAQKGSAVPPIVHEVLRSPGQPLDSETRAFFEPRFAYSFGQVRVHTDSQAAESAAAVGARAYTIGRHVVFGSREWAPASTEGRQLIAHELTHVRQQAARPVAQKEVRFPADSETHFEAEADSMAKRVLRAGTPNSSLSSVLPHISTNTNPVIQRWKIAGNIAESQSEDESLEVLADQIKSDKKNWPCIRPISMRHFKPGKPSAGEAAHYEKFVRTHDRFDISNLTADSGETLRIHLFAEGTKEANVASNFYPGIHSCNTLADVCMSNAAREGKRPIKEFVIFGHQSGGKMYGDASYLTPQELKPDEPRAPFEDAKQGLLPRRCWFTHNAEARSVGCTSIKWGKDFASAFLRKGAAISTTTASVGSKCSSGKDECPNPDQLVFLERPRQGAKVLDGPFSSAAAFHKSKFWETIPGTL